MQLPAEKKDTILIILLLFVAALICYSNVVDAGFIWDDEFIILRSPLIRAPLWSFHMFKQDVLNTSFVYSVYYRPVQILSYAIDYHLWGMNPFAFHLSSIFLHFLNGVLVFLLTRKLTKENTASFLTALLFIIHPAHTGAVSYISGRTDLLFFFFGFLYMLFYVLFSQKRKFPYLTASIIFLGLSLLCKEAAVVFPLLLLFMGIVVLRERPRTRLIYHIPGFLLVGGYAALHHFLFAHKYSQVLKLGDIPGMLARYIDMVKAFLSVIILPIGLHMRRSTAVSSEEMFIFALVASCFILLLFYLKRDRNILLFSLGFFLIALIPFLFMTGHFNVFAEHWVYLPGYGIFLFISLAAVRIYRQKGILVKCAVTGAILTLIIFYSQATINQNRYWRTDTSLSDRVLAFSQEDDAAMYYKTLSSRKEAGFEQSLEEMDTYAESKPLDPEAWYLKGRWALVAGDTDEAERDFKKVLSINPGHFDGYLGLALVAFARGENHKGIKYLEQVVKINPKHSEALLILGAAYSKVGENEKALEVTKKAKRVNPYSYESLVNLGTAYTRLGRLQEGAGYYLEAARLYPERPLAFYNLGQVFLAGGQPQEAEEWLQKAIMVDSEFKPALELLRKIKSNRLD